MSNHAKKYQAGFGTVGVLALVAVVAVVIAGVGFFVSNRHTKTAPAGASISPPAVSPPKVQNPSPVGTQPAPTGAT